MHSAISKTVTPSEPRPHLLHVRSQDEPEEIAQPLVRNPEVDVTHGSRLWPCGCCCRRGEIVGAGSLGMVRPRGSPLRVLSGVGGEVEFPRVPPGTTPHKVWGPAPVAPRKSAHAWAGPGQKLARGVTHAQRWCAEGGVRIALRVSPPPAPPAYGS